MKFDWGLGLIFAMIWFPAAWLLTLTGFPLWAVWVDAVIVSLHLAAVDAIRIE